MKDRLIENTTNLSISPSQDVLSEGHDYVTISCNGVEIGFGFFNVTNLAINSVVFHMCGGYPSSEVVKYVNETDQFLYYDSSVPMVLFFSHCYNIKLHDTFTTVSYWIDTGISQLVVGVNLCGDSAITNVLPPEGADIYMFVYYTNTAILTPTLNCNLNVANIRGDILWNGLAISNEIEFSDKVRVDYYSNFILLLTQSFLVNVHLSLDTFTKVVFVNSDTLSQVGFQGSAHDFSDSDNSGSLMPIHVLFYETSDFISKVTDILHPMLIHDTAFIDSRHNDTLVVKKLTGMLSHQVSLQFVYFYSSSFGVFGLKAGVLALNLAQPRVEAVGQLYLSLNNILASRSLDSKGKYSFQTSACLLCFSNIKQISMTGINFLAVNNGGTVIKLVTSELAVSGNLTIMNGHAHQGRGIFIDSFSTLAFQEPLVAGFYNNFADQGSAIYSLIEQNGQKGESNIQVWPDKKYSINNVTSINISLHFNDNPDGMMYRSFYAPLFSFFAHQTSPNLLFNETTWDSDRSQYAYTTLIDTILHMDRMDKYTSLANGLCIYVHNDWECKYLDETIYHYFSHETCLSTVISILHHCLSWTSCILSASFEQSALQRYKMFHCSRIHWRWHDHDSVGLEIDYHNQL